MELVNLIIHLEPTGNVIIKELYGYESRNQGTLELLRAAVDQVGIVVCRETQVPVYTMDGKLARCDDVSFAYSKRSENADDKVILIPDFIFHSWPEVGISDYTALCRMMIERSREIPKHDQLFWIGNAETHPTRKKFLQMTQGNPLVAAHQMGWDGKNKLRGERLGVVGPYVPLPDHCDYKYLIDLQGNGYSGRLKILLFSGRLLFVQDRSWMEFFFGELKPWEHFVPVREDLEDFFEKLDWAKNNEGEASRIAANAQQFAMDHLTRECAVKALASCLERVAILQQS